MAENEVTIYDKKEAELLDQEISEVEKKALSLEIKDDAGYAEAGEFTKMVKATQKKVKDYWEPMRVSTYSAYKAVMDHKKEMTDPLDNAEKIAKKKISDYLSEKERQRKAKEEELRRIAQNDIERKLKEAEAAERQGNVEIKEAVMEDVDRLMQAAETIHVPQSETKVSGITKTKTWRITSIDPKRVPAYFGGIELRPVDERAVLSLIKGAKGDVRIPGVRFEETYTISARS